MACNVKSIQLTTVNFTENKHGFNVSVRFVTDISAAGDKATDFFLFWYEDGKFVKSYKLAEAMSSFWKIADGELDAFKPDIGKKCSIRIGYSPDQKLAQNICKNQASVITQKYSNIKGSYDGKKFLVTWDKFRLPVTGALQFAHDFSVYEGLIAKNYIEFDLVPHEFELGMVLQFTLLSSMETEYSNGAKCVSNGIDSESVSAYSSAIFPISATREDGNIDLALDIPNYAAIAARKPRCVVTALNKDGNKIGRAEYEISTEDNRCKTRISPGNLVGGNTPLSLASLAIRPHLRLGNFVTSVDLPDNILPLGSPHVVTGLNGATGRLSFAIDGADAYYVSISEDAGEPEFSESAEKVYAQADVLGQKARVAAVYIRGGRVLRGPYSQPELFFEKAFYANQKALKYCSAYGAESVSAAIAGDAFSAAPAEDIEQGPFHLAKISDGGDYIFTIDYSKEFTADTLKGFINKLFGTPTIRPHGYYRICDLIARLSPCAYADGLFYYCRAAASELSNELMPGFSVKVETAYFNKQSSPASADDNGFIKGAVSEYDVNYNGANLEFNSCFDYIGGSWTSAAVSENNDFGGLIDLFWLNHRSPYFKVVYPSAFFNSSRFPRAGDDGNILLCSAEPHIGAQSAEAADKMMRFRGRAAITTEITISVNGQAVKVPLGTTLGKIMARYGGGRLTMRRQTGLGDAVPVYFTDIADIANLFLFAGDSINLA